VVGIVLDVQTDKGLGDAVTNRERDCCGRRHPKVLQAKEQSTVKHSTDVPSPSTEFFSTANNLEDFPFDFAFERGIKFVPDPIQRQTKKQ